MKRLVVVLVVLATVGAAAALVLPRLVPWMVVTRLQAMTNRSVRVDAATLSLREGRLAIRGLHVADRDFPEPFVEVGEVNVRVQLGALLRGHLWIRELALVNPAVRVVRLPGNEFNLSDLVRASGAAGGAAPPDVTVDLFSVSGGTVTLEDRALPDVRTWRSERISIEARNVSTRHADGTAVGSSVTDGAPVSVDVRRLRLYPIDIAATVAVRGANLALARVYMPADAPAVPDRGRVDVSVDASLHARDGLRVDATARLADVLFTRAGDRQPVMQAPATAVRLDDVRVAEDGGVRVSRFELTSSVTVFDPRVTPAARFELPGVRITVADLTWPLGEPARIEVRTGVPGGGLLAAGGTLRPPPAASDLAVRLTNLHLAAWARYLPPSARITGVAEADLRVNEPITGGLPTRIRGSVAVKNVGMADGRQKVVAARRIEASALQVQWPTRVRAGRLLIDRPVALVERDRSGQLPLLALLTGAAPAGELPPADETSPELARSTTAAPASTSPSIGVEVGEIVIRDAAVTWRDHAVKPLAELGASGLDATVRGVSWPLDRPLAVAAHLRPPGGGELRVAGAVDVRQPPSADVRVAAKGAELAPYQSYLPTRGRLSGRADLDVAVKLLDAADGRATVQGQIAVARLDVRDPERTVARIERATAKGIDVQWPHRASISDLALEGPWILLERDERGELPARALLTTGAATRPDGRPSANGRPTAGSQPGANGDPEDMSLAVAVQRLTVDGGGARVVDRSVQPPFAVDVTRLAVEVDGLTTATSGRPARLALNGRVGPDAVLTMQGRLGPLGGPLLVDVSGEIKDFAIPRTNPYLLRHVAWRAREGRVIATVRASVKEESLNARSEIRLRQLALERAGPDDPAQARIGLPLGVLVSLMKNRHGEIALSFPVSGRLNDPRFHVSEAIWKAARTVAINAIATPVSWIGRLQYTADSRIERVQIDPVQFQSGTAILTPEGEAQTMRLAGFLEQVPEARLTLTPVVTSGDLTRLAEGGQPRPADVSALAAKRLEALTAKLKQAKVDGARLVENKSAVRGRAAEGQVQVDLAEHDGAQAAPGLLERLRRLGSGLMSERPRR